ncbi:MAG: hypothetical protein LBB79_03805 [Prevotellaceae bacterium]|jgi:hypothetical protein|nr:hypothetical protein [Prevotellaceae bacterium]
MKKLQIVSSALISVWALLFASCASFRNAPAEAPTSSLIFSTEKTSQYHVQITTNRRTVTGVMILKHMDGEWRGSLMNEFGVKAFDFAASKKRCTLSNTAAMLNKWYIRKTIEGDFYFLLWGATQHKRGKSLQRLPEGALLLKNEKRNMTYLFQPIGL